MADDRVGEVRAADRLALGLSPLKFGLVELVAELPQGGAHRRCAVLAVIAPGAQAVAEHRIAVIDEVAEHVEVLLVAVHGGDSTARTTRIPRSDEASIASCTPSTVSWSLSASNSTPACAAAATTSRGSSAPSEWSEWLWRSKVGGSVLKRREGSRYHASSARRPLR